MRFDTLPRRMGGGLVMGVTILLSGASASQANIVTDWNAMALKTVVAGKVPGPGANRVMPIVQAAVFDAVNSIAQRYQGYGTIAPAPKGASLEAAASEAAFRTLLDLVPNQKDELTSFNQGILGKIADGRAKTDGIAAGDAAAAAELAARRDDGYDPSSEYHPGSGPGVYQLTSPNQVTLGAHFAKMRPFVLKVSSQFRPPPPPALDSAQFLRDLAETQSVGRIDSTTRNGGWTPITRFHAPAGLAVWNAIARLASEARGLDLVDTARTMALLDFALTDAASVGFDAKYEYNFWRPVTAINAGLRSIEPDPTWKPLLETPPFPEYPCLHCIVGAAAQVVLESVFGDGPLTFDLPTAGPGSPAYEYHSFRQYAEEEAESRVYAGVHYRWSLMVGTDLGQEVGTLIATTALRPR